MSVSNKFTLKSDVCAADNGRKQKKNDKSSVKDIVFFNPAQTKNTDAGNLPLLRITVKSGFVLPLLGEWRQRKRTDGSIISGYLRRMLFYISLKSSHESIASANGVIFYFLSPLGQTERSGGFKFS